MAKDNSIFNQYKRKMENETKELRKFNTEIVKKLCIYLFSSSEWIHIYFLSIRFQLISFEYYTEFEDILHI